MGRGFFVTFEGGEGSGKSTQVSKLRKRLEEAGIEALFTREPGGTRVGEEVRKLLLGEANNDIVVYAELMLYEAARVQLVDEMILPALAEGKLVCCDRFVDSTTAYQGYGRGLNLEDITLLNRVASLGVRPDLTFFIDIDPELGLKRATEFGADRLEQAGLEFHIRVRNGFLEIAKQEPERFVVIDGSRSIEEVEMDIWEKLLERSKGAFS